ncbi:hypothetical protein [Synechococcus phage MA10]|uniref:Uncharacterized protein n=1 Tax=Synechococcus phage S-H34 TaxID=2718942 RepID=A0A6G8R6M3_9CAUD|nr:hypothetical protein PQC15_gp162 [Synechococcus phage S-H34]QIN97033.1 hypothetical protein [Synechococcus phage S-H34]
MAVKVLVTAIGQHLMADVKQVEDQDSGEVLAYWLTDAQLVNYEVTEEGQIGVQFGSYCPIANGGEFSLRRDHVVAILDPREDALATYTELTNPATVEAAIDPEVVTDATESDSPEE